MKKPEITPMHANGIKIDTSAFEAIGMKILTAEDVEGLRSGIIVNKQWPSSPSFEPAGVSLEHAREATKLCMAQKETS